MSRGTWRRCRSCGSCRWRCYLLSFILCFDSDFWYRRWFWWPGGHRAAPVRSLVPARGQWRAADPAGAAAVLRRAVRDLHVSATANWCAHGPRRGNTRFYLMISLGVARWVACRWACWRRVRSAAPQNCPGLDGLRPAALARGVRASGRAHGAAVRGVQMAGLIARWPQAGCA